MGFIKALTMQCVPSFFYRGKVKDSVSVAESAIADTFKTPTDSKLSPSQASLSPAGWSVRSKVEIAALLLFFSYRAASLATTAAVNTVPPVVLTVLLGIIIFRICQISMKNLIQNTALNVAAGMATVALGPNPTGHTPEDDFDGIVHDLGAVGVLVIPNAEDPISLPTPEEVLVTVATGMATVALGPNPTGSTPEDDFDGIVHDMGGLGVFVIPNREPKAPLPEAEPEDPYDWLAEMIGLSPVEKKTEAPKVAPQPIDSEPEESSDWASSMGGFFFGAIHAIGFLFLM